MVTGAQGRKPNYFFVAFGAKYAGVNPVEGQAYPHLTHFVVNSGIVAGDVMILYCCGGYPGHDQQAPGIGVVTGLARNEDDARLTNIYYQFLPLCQPLHLHAIKAGIPELKDKLNFSLGGNLLRQIGSNSFRAVIAGRQIDWP